MIETCRLCLNQRELKGSHIIPEFLHRPIYDDKGRAEVLEMGERKRYAYKGYREPLLCERCEQRMSRLEDYFARLWYGRKPALPPTPTPPAVEVYVDYARFKLFHLSILWRASISSLPFYEKVNLGVTHAETLRTMLLSESPGEPTAFPIYGIVLTGPKGPRLARGSIMQPLRDRHRAGLWLYILTFGSCVWYYYISSHLQLASFAEYALSDTGRILMPVEDQATFVPFDNFWRTWFAKRPPRS
jgi:hypothetical protein